MNREVSNAVYASIANMLASSPANFTATANGLAFSIAAVDDALGCIPRSHAITAAMRDGYLIKVSRAFWLLLPEAFDCADEYLPRGVRDCRDMSARDVMGAAMAA
jgi:hypothetical protein